MSDIRHPRLHVGPEPYRHGELAYGVAAYELLTDHKPFPRNCTDILGAQLEPASPIPPREHNGDIPAALEKVILKCLERGIPTGVIPS